MDNTSREDPIDDLLDRAASCAKKRLDDESFVDFDFAFANTTSCADILDGKHDLVGMREDASGDGGDDGGDDGGGRQRGMHAKRDIRAGTNLVVAKPIAVCWDVEVEDDDSDDDDDGEDELLRGVLKGCSGSDDSGDDDSVASCDHHVDEDGHKSIYLDAELNKFDEEPSSGRHTEENGEEGSQTVSGRKTTESGDDHSDDEDDSLQEATGLRRNGILVLRALERIEEDPSSWTDALSKLFPRDVDAALALPPWLCGDASLGMEIEARFAALPSLALFPRENKATCGEIAVRLPLIVRYNVLSVETCPELFVYPDVRNGGMAGLAGTGLYGPEISYFNHSCVPNVSRYCIGDIMFFVANRDVLKGEELCFSYIGHEFLSESAAKRSMILDMDFELKDAHDDVERPAKKRKAAKTPPSKRDDGVHHPLIDEEMQNALMATPPLERLELIDELLGRDADPVRDYRCDGHQLRVLRAIALDGLGEPRRALPEWEAAADFAAENFPPLDEASVALRVQAALCAAAAADGARAGRHAAEARRTHDSLFGGGSARFFKRYEKEFACRLRPILESTSSISVKELFG